MRYYIIAGEASGDLHASNLIRSINELDGAAEWRGWGGDLMQNEGLDIVKHYRDTAVVGLLNVIWKIRSIARNLKSCKADLLNYSPDVLILVDYPGFNLRIAEFAKQNGMRVYYYIAPKVWASREKRIEKIKAFTDEVFTILPFEVDYFKKHGVHSTYVGNPVVDAIRNETNFDETSEAFRERHNLDERPIIAILAGSRSHEVKKILPTMLSVLPEFKTHQFVVAGVPVLGASFYEEYAKNSGVKIIFEETYNLLRHSHAAMVTSGTATLETALLKVPQVVCYNVGGGKVLFWLYKSIIKVKYLSLVNLILDELLVTELLQHHLTKQNLCSELNHLTQNGVKRRTILEGYQKIIELLGNTDVSHNAAQNMVDCLRKDMHQKIAK